MKFLSLFLIVGYVGLMTARSEILLKTQPEGTGITAELMPGASLELLLRVTLSDGGESIRSDVSDGGTPAAEGGVVDLKRLLVFPSGEEVQVERRAEVEGGTVHFQEKWQGSLQKGGVYLNAFFPFQDLTDAKVQFLDANGEEVAPDAPLVAGKAGSARGLKCQKIKILGWKDADLTFQFGTPVDCYVYSRKNGENALVDFRVLVQRAGVSSMDFEWSVAAEAANH